MSSRRSTSFGSAISVSHLQELRKEAARRNILIAERWIRRFNILKVVPGVRGRAWPKSRTIKTPWPATTRYRLYIFAHEIGHVALQHTGSKPVYQKEYEAETFAHALLRESSVAVPRKMTLMGKTYVARKIGMGIKRGARAIDPAIAAWAEVTLPPDRIARSGLVQKAHDAVRVALQAPHDQQTHEDAKALSLPAHVPGSNQSKAAPNA